ncbi:MAG: META domain-containing protein [Ferruginibacter sp.]
MNKVLLIVSIILTGFSCATANKTQQKNATQASAVAGGNEQKLQAGIDFTAKGTQPASWTLEIDLDKAIRLKSIDGTNIVASSVSPTENADQSIQFETSTQFGNMRIIIYHESCTDALSKESYGKKVVITVNGKTYEGCGSFLSDAAINATWILQEIKNKKTDKSDYAKGLPELTFNITESKLSGHDGCNKIFGDAEVWGSFIRFHVIGSTKMACPGKSSSSLPADISDKTLSYVIKSGELYLSMPNDGVAIFKKK